MISNQRSQWQVISWLCTISGKADFEKTADYSLFSVLDGQGSLNVDGQDYDIAKGGYFILPSDVQAWEIEGNLELIVSHP